MIKQPRRVLIIDDDANLGFAVGEYLRSMDYAVQIAQTAVEGLAACAASSIDVVLLDQKLPDAAGAELCPAILGHNAQTKIIFSTAFPNIDNAILAIRQGAYDYLSKPFELEELSLAIGRAMRTLELEKAEQYLNFQSDREGERNTLVGHGHLITAIRRSIMIASEADAPVLLTGETGCGKNVAARSIHDQGPDRHAPFIAVNCAALPETLIEAELFGHEKGAFTGAGAMKRGLFELAEGGTLFLDEIGELSMQMQAKLLGVLDDGSYRRIGGSAQLTARVRIIAATGVDLEEATANGRFRRDLYYRIGVIGIQMPSLRDRTEDLPELCEHLLIRVAKGRRVILAEGEIERLAAYHWPGNVRELRNVLERSVLLREQTEIRPSAYIAVSSGLDRDRVAAPSQSVRQGTDHIRPSTDRLPFDARISLRDDASIQTLAAIERAHIITALKNSNGNHTHAARAIGISLSTFKRRLKQYQISWI